MDEFMRLRAAARRRRDSEIDKARQDYETSLKRIAELEQRLLGKPDKDQVPMSAAIEQVIPREAEFTIIDVMHALEAKDTSRIWKKVSVGRYITNLREKGLIRRVKRAKANAHAAYVRTNGRQEPDARDKTLRQIITEAVTRPMYIAEVCVAVREAGYATTMIPAHFRTHCIHELRAVGFKLQGGKWLP
jgi:hypothetical protein